MKASYATRFNALASSPYILILLLFAGALLTRLIGVGDAPPRTDDLYNFIAAKSWMENGTLAMADGVYKRAKLYSIVTAWFLEFFGTSLGVARSVAAIGGAVLVPLLAIWVRRIGDPVAAWSAGLLLCFSYTCITWAQVARFYSWHAVAMLVLSMVVYRLTIDAGNLKLSRQIALGGIGLIALGLGMHLQPITFIMALALAIWVTCYLLFSGRLNFILRSSPLLIGSLAMVAIMFALAFTVGRHLILGQWDNLRKASAWSAENQNNFAFYIDQLSHQLGWLFWLFPLAVIVAWRRQPTVVIFCVTITAICLILHTIAGMKALRYVMYLFPFIFTVWGLAVSVFVAYFTKWTRNASAKALPRAMGAALALVTAVALLLVADYRQTAAAAVHFAKTGDTFRPFDYGFGRDQVDWTPYLPALRALQKYGLFVVSDSNRAIYYLDDYDLLLSKTELSDISNREFALDVRTGKRDIGSGVSIAKVIACYPKGSILATEAQWRSAYVSPDAADVIERKARQVKLPPASYLRAYQWEHPVSARSAECAQIYRMIGKDAKSISR